MNIVTTQDIFDTVANHLLTQGEKSTLDGVGCAYRGPSGLKCAVGVLISDDWYLESLERRVATSDKVIRAVQGSIGRALTTEEEQLLQDLQMVHDHLPPDDWYGKLVHTAKEYKLNPPSAPTS